MAKARRSPAKKKPVKKKKVASKAATSKPRKKRRIRPRDPQREQYAGVLLDMQAECERLDLAYWQEMMSMALAWTEDARLVKTPKK